MKVIILTTLTLVLCVVIPQCFAAEAELLELLRDLTEVDEKLKPIPPVSGLTKKHSDPEACGKYAAARRDSRGTVDFPEGNHDYSSFSDCAWAIIGGPNSQITVTFTFANIENDNPCDDFMKIYSMTEKSGGDYDYIALTNKICPKQIGNMNPRTFTTNRDGIYVEFKSDWWSNERGFIFNYEINRSGGSQTPIPAPSPGGGGATDGPVIPGGSNDIVNLSCDFDRSSLCGWNNVNYDVMDWKVQKGTDSPWRSWGKIDHTTGSSSGAYAYLYTNNATRNQGGKLVSPVLSARQSGGRCLTFYYNMLQTDGAFRVILKYSGGGRQTVLQRDGSQGSVWLKATVSLLSKEPYSIEFEHTRGSIDVETGLAIDDIKVSDQQCSSRLNSCGTNIYGTRKRRDLRSLLKTILELKDEEKKELEDRIIGGQQSQKGQFPWIAHIRIFAKGIESGRYSQCGGSVIDQQWILTAAHCFEDDSRTYDNPENVRIYLGEHNTHYQEVEESQFVLIPEKVIVHPDRNSNAYGLGGHRYDVTLLKLKYKLTFTDSVNAVCLPDRPFNTGTECIAAGWGLAEDGDSSEQLLHLSKYIQSDRDCQPYTITEDMICAIAHSGVADVCQGDSGGPLVCRRSGKYELAGAVSFGDACAERERTSGVYADIYYFMSWIKSTIA